MVSTSAAVCCRLSGSQSVVSRQEKHALHGIECQSELGDSDEISFEMIASMDARTLPLVLLQSSRVYLVVAGVSQHHHNNDASADLVTKMNAPCVDISFEQLVISLAQLQRMLVSNSYF